MCRKFVCLVLTQTGFLGYISVFSLICFTLMFPHNTQLPWPFWAPTVLESAGQENRVFPLPDQKSKAEGVNTTGFVYEAEEVRRCIRAGYFAQYFLFSSLIYFNFFTPTQ